MHMHEFEEHRFNAERELSGFQIHAHINLCDIAGVNNDYYPVPVQTPASHCDNNDYYPVPVQTSASHCDSNVNNSVESKEHCVGKNEAVKSESPYSLYFGDALTGAAREEHCRVELLNARQMYGPQSLEVAEKLIRLGDSCEDQSKTSESENYYRQAAGIAQKFDNDPEAAGLLLSLSRRAEQHGKYQEADRWDDKAYKTFDKLPSIDF